VEVKHVCAASPLVKIIDILGNDGYFEDLLKLP
jgi:hypothetical protein